MAWIPTLMSQSGIYGGQKVPQGSLTGFPREASITGTVLQCSTVWDSQTHEDSWQWDYKFGCTGQKLLNAFLRDTSGQWHEGVHLFEFEIEKPENAQYYKQTLAIYVDYECNIDETSSYNTTYFRLNITKMSRLEYATPTAVPTEELICTGSVAAVLMDAMGPEGVIPAAYNYRQGKWLLGFSPLTYGNKRYWGAYFYAEYRNVSWERDYGGYYMLAIEEQELAAFFSGFDPEATDDPNEDPDPDPEDDPPGGGGDGEQDKKQDPIPEPDLPPLSGTAAGFVTTYKLYETSMQTFAHDLFDPDIWDAVKAFFADPMDFICGIIILPFSPHTSRSARPVLKRTPLIAWSAYYPVIEQQYHIVDCGTIEVPMYYKSALDYNPMTSDVIYLPYIGYRKLDPDEVQGQTLRIKYHVDVMTGDCIAFIIRTAISGTTPVSQVIAQFSGNCGTRVAFGRQSFDNAIGASIQLMAGAVGTIGGLAMLAGGAGGLASGGKQIAEGMIASSITGITGQAVNASKTRTERSGVMGASAGYMGIQFPYLIRQVPHQDLPDKGYYRRLNGYPCNKAGKLSDFSGFTCLESIELSGIPATQDEKTEILNMLTGGVIV